MNEKGEHKTGRTRRKRRRLSGDVAPVHCSMNAVYAGDEFTQELSRHFHEKDGLLDDNGAVLHTDPFPCCALPNFISDPQFLQDLEKELQDIVFNEKNNDLYKFQQSEDLANMRTGHVKGLRKFFLEDVRKWMTTVTGIPLFDKVDLTCSKYEYTDTLLCHDDELSRRRIAFILYLVPAWCDEDGGALDLFSVDGHGQPDRVVKSVQPAWNKFAFFEVSPVSFHQVAEVFSKSKTRLSINGWFHGPDIERPAPYLEPPRTKMCAEQFEGVIEDWINEVYLTNDTHSQIQEKFEEDSEIQLRDFLKEDKHVLLMEAVKEQSIKIQNVGPPNKRLYQLLVLESLPDIVKQAVALFRSQAMFEVLSNISGLDLRKKPMSSDEPSTSSSQGACNDEVSTACCSCEVRQWSHGSYTLVHDLEAAEFALDANYFFNCADWSPEYGGYTYYMARDEDEELLTVNPVENSLALVYRDRDTLQFVKHINHQFKENFTNETFNDISLVYYESNGELAT